MSSISTFEETDIVGDSCYICSAKNALLSNKQLTLTFDNANGSNSFVNKNKVRIVKMLKK